MKAGMRLGRKTGDAPSTVDGYSEHTPRPSPPPPPGLHRGSPLTHPTVVPSSLGAPGLWVGAQGPPRLQVPLSLPGMPAGAWAHARVSGKPVFEPPLQLAPHRHGFGTPESGSGGQNRLSSSVYPVPAHGPRKSGLARPRGCLPVGLRSSPVGSGPDRPASPAWPAGHTMSHWAVSPAPRPLLPALERLQRGCERTAGAESLPAAPWGLPPPDSSGLAF